MLLLLGVALMLTVTAAPASAAGTLTLTPTTGAAGTRVDVLASDCNVDATGDVEGTDVRFELPEHDNRAQGHFIVTEQMRPGDYTVAVTCGFDTVSARFIVASGTGASTGGGSTASHAATALLWSGAALVLAAATGLWILRRRDVTAA
jgi:hypothetical protein